MRRGIRVITEGDKWSLEIIPYSSVSICSTTVPHRPRIIVESSRSERGIFSRRYREYAASIITILVVIANTVDWDRMIVSRDWVHISTILIITASAEPPKKEDEEKSK